MWRYRADATVDYAGFWLRLAAFIVDGIIMGVLVWVFNGVWSMAFGLGWMGGTTEFFVTEVEGGTVFWVLGILITFLMISAYLIGFWAWRGQTPGKMLLRLKVLHGDGSNIGWGTAVIRYLGFIISTMVVLLGHIWVLFDSRRQGLHDKIADTVVIRLPKTTS